MKTDALEMTRFPRINNDYFTGERTNHILNRMHALDTPFQSDRFKSVSFFMVQGQTLRKDLAHETSSEK